MKSIVYEQFGEPADVLRLTEEKEPTPGRGEVRVRVLASPINPSDLMTIRGVYGRRPTLPATPGYEGVGVVEAAGPGLYGRMLVGRRVAFLNGETGNWREKTIASARQCVPLSDAIPLEQAAMFFVNPVTAYAMTRAVLKIEPGQWLLQTAAGSSLGRMVIRLGQRYGFRTLCVIRRTDQKAELESIGADAVIATDKEDMVERTMAITGGKGAPFVIDCVGGKTASDAVRTLAVGGRMLLYGNLSGESMTFNPRDLLTPGARMEGFWLARWMPGLPLLRRLRVVRTVGSLIKEGVLRSEVGQAFPLDRVTDAVREAEKMARGGKAYFRLADR